MSFDHLIVSDTNECTEFPCQHNGTCLNNEGSYKCDCTAGWKDKDCKTGAPLNEPKFSNFLIAHYSITLLQLLYFNYE